MNIDVKLV